MKTLIACLFLSFGLLATKCSKESRTAYLFEHTVDDKMGGITMVAPPKEFPSNPMPAIKEVHANWVAFVPYGYSRMGEASVQYNIGWQWWGERTDGVKESIRLAHLADLKVMLKPQVYVPGGWIGTLDYATDAEWEQWEQDYRSYIMDYVQMAKSMNVEMLCIGTEIKLSTKKRTQFWRDLIVEIRKIYDGKLTYSCNWDSYQDIAFWDDLDYIGISAYFPLSDDETPTIKDLKKEWQPVKKQLEIFAGRQKKKIIFTEYGYQSVDGCAGKAWEIEKDHDNRAINEQGQSNALAAINETFSREVWWAGGFLWKWFPNMSGHEGYPAKDYTPQGKIAAKTLFDYHQSILPHRASKQDIINTPINK